MSIGSNYFLSQYTIAHDIDTASAGSHISGSSPQLLHARISGSSISEPTSSPGLEMVWPARPSALPNPKLLRHLYVGLYVNFLGRQCSMHDIQGRCFLQIPSTRQSPVPCAIIHQLPFFASNKPQVSFDTYPPRYLCSR
jgi:hypothetical protein